MKFHVPDAESIEQHRRFLAWREWLIGGVPEQAEGALREIGYDDLDADVDDERAA